MTDDNPFDLTKIALTPAQIETQWASTPRKIAKRRERFVKVPGIWVERLAHTRHVVTYRLALHILYRHWEVGGKPFTLSNVVVAIEGISRWQKWRALTELERLGLITVERRKRRAPSITVIVTPEINK
jgi:hypothetical protein